MSNKNIVERQKVIWEKNWNNQMNIDFDQILNSRFSQEAYKCINNFIDEGKDKFFLEAGCGTGRFCCLIAKHIPVSQVIGIDISQNSIKIATSLKEHFKISNVSFKIGNLFQFPYPDNYFDVVFNEGVIEHFPRENTYNYEKALKEMIRVTKHKGKIIVAVPNYYNFIHTFYKWLLNKLGKKYKYGFEKSFKHSELRDLFIQHGLKDIEISGFYPSHGFYRLSGNGFYKIFYYLGKITDIFENIFTNLSGVNLNKKFGFEIVIKGEKS